MTLGLACFCLPLAGLAAPQRTVEVLADEVEMDLETGHTAFYKNVRIVLNQYRITCHKAEVKVDPKTRQLREIIMTGSVIIQGKDGVVRSKKVIFNALTNKLRLEGTVYTRIQVDLPPEFKP
ncbi:MAG: LptA/OstA family protein [Candidatus Sericytochromatia bacterium]